MTEHQNKLSVLFVDDEIEILNGLRLTLRKERKRFDMRFAEGGLEALESLKNEPVDVVCTDLQMPDIDGSELLEQLLATYPSTGRIVLSGHADDDVALRAMSLAHRFLVKPTHRESIVQALTEVRSTLGSIERPDLREVIGSTARLPASPTLHSQLITTLEDDRSDTESIAGILSQDPAMAAKLLQFANSSYLSPQPNIASIAEAARLLGRSTLLAIVTHLGCVDAPAQADPTDVQRDSDLRTRARLTARVASHIAHARHLDTELAATAGLLSGIGIQLLNTRTPELAKGAELRATADDLPLHEAQQLELGVDHASLAAALLGSWGLPRPVVELIRNIHTPSATSPSDFDLNGVLHVAHYLAHQSLNQLTSGHSAAPQYLDPSYIHRTGVSADVRVWNDFTRQLAEQVLKESDYKAA